MPFRSYYTETKLNPHMYYKEDRDDVSKYSYLAGSKSFKECFEDTKTSVHENLQEALDSNNFRFTTPIQE